MSSTRRSAALLLLAAAGSARAASLSLEGTAVILGRTESASCVIRVDEPPATEELPLRLSVNVGSFSEPVRLGPGVYRAVYIPPETRFPQVALIAVWRETGPDARIDFLRIPLFGMSKLPVSAKPGSEVKAQIGFETFGPIKADRRGRATIPLIVPPNVNEANVTVREGGGAVATRKVPVEVPPYNRLTAALVPHAVLADGKSLVRLDVLYDLGGIDLSPEQVKVKASLGEVSFQRTSRGLYVYHYVPPAAAGAKEVTLSVSVAGDPTARATARLSLGLPPPARVLVHAPAKSLVAGNGQSAAVSALVLDSAGLGLSGQTVRITANDQPVGTAQYRGNGVYEAAFTAPSTYPPGGLVQFQAVATDPSGRTVNGSANYQLQAAALPGSVTVRTSPNPVPLDGKTEAILSLDVRDAAGMPLERTKLMVAASHGTLGKLSERGQGIYQASYLAPARADGKTFVRVVDPSGAFERVLPLPLREDPHRLLLGARGGYTRGLGSTSGGRFGLDLTVPFRIGAGWFSAGLAAEYGTASRTIADPATGASSRSDATFAPVSLRLAWELWAGRRLSFSVGGGGTLTLARFTNDLAGAEQRGMGFGGLGFAALGLAVGPGQLFAEVSYAYEPVQVTGFRLDAGGLGATAGYRVGIF